MLLYTEKITNRLTYIAEFIFDIIGKTISITDKLSEFEKYNGVKINYSNKSIDHSIQIIPHEIIFEHDIKNQNILIYKSNYPYFFNTGGNLGFDLFAASFYLITRYEEYLSDEKDMHGRFMAKNSLAYKNDFLRLPVIDIWVYELEKEIKSKFPYCHFETRKYKYTPTIDIDVAYFYKSKRRFWAVLLFIKKLLRLNFKDIKAHLNVVFNHGHDPYDTYNVLQQIHQKYGLECIYFLAVGKYGKYDKNISPHSKAFKELVGYLQKNNQIGIHPSYNSNKNTNILKREINIFKKLSLQPVIRSRQHFLKLRLPDTYRNLIRYGIKKDYTMGYADEPGFRAGTCTPFYFYDLKDNKQTDLKIFPFAIMDGTLNSYKNYNKNEALTEVEKIAGSIKHVNGECVTIWHNSSLCGMYEWKGWEDFYNEVIAVCK